MAVRIVQAGSGATRALVLVYHLRQENDDALRRAVPADVAIANDTRTQAEYESVPALADTVRELEQKLGCKLAPVVLCGYSAGGFATRRILKSGGAPDALVLADATYGTDVDAWRAFASRAKQGDAPFIAAHCQYIAAQADNPWNGLRLVTGWDLPRVTAITPRREGALVVYSFPDEDHSAQGRIVFPNLIGEAIAALGRRHASSSSSSSGSAGGGGALLALGLVGALGLMLFAGRR